MVVVACVDIDPRPHVEGGTAIMEEEKEEEKGGQAEAGSPAVPSAVLEAFEEAERCLSREGGASSRDRSSGRTGRDSGGTAGGGADGGGGEDDDGMGSELSRLAEAESSMRSELARAALEFGLPPSMSMPTDDGYGDGDGYGYGYGYGEGEGREDGGGEGGGGEGDDCDDDGTSPHAAEHGPRASDIDQRELNAALDDLCQWIQDGEALALLSPRRIPGTARGRRRLGERSPGGGYGAAGYGAGGGRLDAAAAPKLCDWLRRSGQHLNNPRLGDYADSISRTYSSGQHGSPEHTSPPPRGRLGAPPPGGRGTSPPPPPAEAAAMLPAARFRPSTCATAGQRSPEAAAWRPCWSWALLRGTWCRLPGGGCPP